MTLKYLILITYINIFIPQIFIFLCFREDINIYTEHFLQNFKEWSRSVHTTALEI